MIYIVSSFFEIILYKFVFKQFALVRIPSVLVLLQQIGLGIILGGLSALFEEIGWRGFLQSRFKVKNTLISYFVVGICWAIFHFPQIFDGLIYRGHLITGVFIHTCILVSFGILLCFLREKSSSLVSTSIAHGLFNVLIYTQATDVILGGSQIIEGTLWAISCFIIIIASFFKGYMKKLKLIANFKYS